MCGSMKNICPCIHCYEVLFISHFLIPSYFPCSPPLPSSPPFLPPAQLYRLESRSGRTVQLIQTAAPDWRRLAYALHLTAPVVSSIHMDSLNQVELACERALCRWLSEGSRQPVAWETLLLALREAGLLPLASSLELVLREGVESRLP